MRSEIVYMLGIVAAGFAVNFGLRALPFLLFAGKGRELPRWVERFGTFVSPVIITALIVYSYSGLAWKTAWPYLAGVLVVGLQVWKRNPLVSIVAGTALYMALLTCGCATQTVSEIDAAHPELRLAADGVYMGETRVAAEDVVGALEDAEVPKDRAIHIRMDRDMSNMQVPRALMAILARGGYTRSLLVTEEHGESKTKSGKTYAESERLTRRSDVDFYVTGEGVSFGLLTSVGPDDVLRCLQANQVDRDQLIRLNFRGSEEPSPDLQRNLGNLESILRKAGYGNVRRFDVEKRPKQQASGRQGQSPGASSSPSGARTGFRSQGKIRYKRADE